MSRALQLSASVGLYMFLSVIFSPSSFLFLLCLVLVFNVLFLMIINRLLLMLALNLSLNFFPLLILTHSLALLACCCCCVLIVIAYIAYLRGLFLFCIFEIIIHSFSCFSREKILFFNLVIFVLTKFTLHHQQHHHHSVKFRVSYYYYAKRRVLTNFSRKMREKRAKIKPNEWRLIVIKSRAKKSEKLRINSKTFSFLFCCNHDSFHTNFRYILFTLLSLIVWCIMRAKRIIYFMKIGMKTTFTCMRECNEKNKK